MNIFVIHSLKLTELAVKYAKLKEINGLNKCYVPGRQTDQSSDRHTIIKNNLEAIKWADECHLVWDGESQGSLVDIGSAYALDKPLYIAHVDESPLAQSIDDEKVWHKPRRYPWTQFVIDYKGKYIWR